MLRKLGLGLLGFTLLFTTNAFAMRTIPFSQTAAIEFELKPNDPLVLVNFFFWSIKATCTVSSETEDNPVLVKALRKSGTINEMELVEGDTRSFNFKNRESFTVSAVSGAKVEFVNQGEKPIKAICTPG
ncbi:MULTISPECIES: hypothetical protein [Legionella]|uniref:Uncharacterized protein n=1 Tax=Legionella septentrionalis TaxID=2498109 RepID=A0A3S1CKI0_9GAMM|nr:MULTISPECIES: hypothetical protein [Legionella]MCP0914681.1 hypothetical protein [Legionella sp. 27cVA30]RUQ81603.1 hypothetical protein EKM59_10040 [Legionella septentrionalis]RUQ95751.1 hypothetical protein ELY11_08730 [Legionella septentrionalis]RUR09135.1 hypothetical protein ELY14_09565 [Legionella septentrionalis]RUR15642.1 hypothetical protein ELY10_05475 [Legionella septentrionalis]